MIPDGNLLKHVLRQQKVRALALVPAVVEQLLNEPNGIDFFRNLDYLCHGGAPMNPVVGNRLSKITTLVSPFGATEIFSQPELVVAPEDWQWHEFNPHLKHEMQVSMRRLFIYPPMTPSILLLRSPTFTGSTYPIVQSTRPGCIVLLRKHRQVYDPNEATFELVIFADESNKDRSGLYHNLPSVTEYHTKDLFTRHLDKPQLFKYYGRKDDIIVLANGEKFNPLALEMHIQSHHLLKGALVVGNRRTQTALLVEPNEPLDEKARIGFLKQFWPFIEESNVLASGQGRIHPGKVICALPDKPFVRTAKGTVVRRLTEEAYKDVIEHLYSSAVSKDTIPTMELKATFQDDLPNIVKFVRNVFAVSFPQASTMGEEEDFFAHGLDSIQTLEIVSSLKRNLQEQSKPTSWVSPQAIFYNSSLTSFSKLIKDVIDKGIIPEAVSEATLARSVDETVERFVTALPEKSPLQGNKSSNISTIAFIGSTGYLGSNTVATLLKRPGVSRIYSLNRSHDAKIRQEAALLKIDEGVKPLLAKLHYMTVDLGKPLLGLTQNEYDVLVREVGVIVYNSWRLDFGLSIRSFEPFLETVGKLVKLSTVSNHDIHIVFVSSLASVGNLAKTGRAPEALVQTASAALNTGYAQSKLAAERILAAASQNSGVPVSILRVGQIGGSTNDQRQQWADQPWISSLIRTARELRCAPSHVSLIDWTPVDTVAEILGNLTIRPVSTGANFINVWSPQSPSWELLLGILADTYGIRETVSLREWVQRLRSIPYPNADDVSRLPALRLLEYYDALGDGMETVSCETNHAISIAQTRVPPVTKQMLEGWLQGWDL